MLKDLKITKSDERIIKNLLKAQSKLDECKYIVLPPQARCRLIKLENGKCIYLDKLTEEEKAIVREHDEIIYGKSCLREDIENRKKRRVK